MSTSEVDALNAKIEELQIQLSRSKSYLRKASQSNKKMTKKGKTKKVRWRKGFDTKKPKSNSRSRPTKKAHQKPSAHKKRSWKPPTIFAVADEESFVFEESEATVLKKKIFEHLKNNNIEIRQTATESTIDEIVEAEYKRSENVSSVFLVNIGWIVDQYLQWKYLMPRVMPFYAVKSNPDVNILRALTMLGAGFDVASEAELAAVKALGANSDDMIFANPCKGKSHIRFAKEKQVPMMTFDNTSEVDKIMEIYPQAKLVLRVLPDDKYSLMPFGKKFGASWEECQILIQKCKDVGANLIGVSFHVGSGCFGTVAYRNALVLAKEVMDYAATQGVNMTLLDIGGGFPGDDGGTLSFGEIAEVITPLLDELFPKSSGIRIIGEPGRYFCSGSSTLAVVVNSKRKKKLVLAEPKSPDVNETENQNQDDYLNDDERDGDENVEEDEEEEEGAVITQLVRPLGSSVSAPNLIDLEQFALNERLDLELNRVGLPEGKDDEGGSTSEDDVVRNPQASVSEEHEFLYYLSDGVYGSFNNIIFDHAQPQPVLLDTDPDTPANIQSKLSLYRSRLFGPTCDSIDVICDCVELPELDIGDWLLFPNMGAYTVAAASSFNGFAPPNSTYIMEFDDDESDEE